MELLTLFGLIALPIFLVATFFQRAATENTLPNRLISWVINVYLRVRFPIKSADGQTTIPGCRYVYPNGQGNMAKFYQDQSVQWREQFGAIYRIWNGMRPEVIVGCPEDIKAIFHDSGQHLKAQDMNAGWLAGALMGQCLGLVNQDRWARMRAAMAEPFHQRTAPSYIGLMEKRVQQALDAIEAQKLPSQPQPDGTPAASFVVDPAQELLYLPFFILGDILYGAMDEAMERELRELAELRDALWKQAMGGGLARYAIGRYLPAPRRQRQLHEFHARWKAFNDGAVHRATATHHPDAPIVALYRAVADGQLSETELLHTLDELVFVNLDVTVGNFSWNPVFLAAHAAVQREVVAEIRQARGGGGGGWKGYLASSSTLLQAAILESARLKPMASFAVPQACPTDRLVGGFVIPAHTEIVVDTEALNVHNPVWGADRYDYRPRRFLDKSPVAWRYHFWRFGFGPRQCLGRHVVDLLLKILLAQIVERYELLPAWKESEKPAGEKMEYRSWEKNPDVWMNLAMQPIAWKKRAVESEQ
ncbi:cytochrome P450 [Aspergillus aculeatinus CBS 121060]|uniref:Cytochrome P450 oxidoreductase GliC n=1 Tax=Aspergillus aculeatinus CBS 121060 TaxID=1448322 RepID=A0ACD1GVZ6_9EURO|nr:cytochrome P450 oxidoreductase GliC [Aspergillus aculeatinus CBS 121060]RAH65639.1 cytochrome P450 oxidoreductase GliC [Aspergillus aculeatinus CBS 121060]